ncbi:hypothetical protein HX852_03355 [Marine Group I thaumarchaeote]|uniref:Uncharacterized protein n=1 Tax=Marine Group I thaumarchaeote TaxID=2511932 RepID=A0A7K4P0W4_9ARCH|nr:hypothetical protein [Marine Group I thaumarchaeote]
MNNKIGRKITSLTIITIMIAGGMTIGAPGMIPSAAAENQLLFVSAENEAFGNSFGGGQIVEIIVRDPNHSDTEDSEAAPTVEINGNAVIMAQGIDGYWYAYIGDTAGVLLLDNAGTHAYGLDYGDSTAGGANLTDATNSFQQTGSDNLYANATAVIGGAPTLSSLTGNYGQVGLANATDWPILQVYDLTLGSAEIVLEQAGPDESVLLDYTSMEDFAGIEIDRSAAPVGAEVHLTITDYQLNIDPTTEETIIFNYSAGTAKWGATANTALNTANACDTNCALLLTFNTNGPAVLDWTTTTDYVTEVPNELLFTETSANSGVWSNTDSSDNASLNVVSTAIRGTTATVNYNDSSQSFSVSTSTGVIDMDESSVGDEWNSGESMAITLTDGDLDINTASEQTISFNSTNIPTIVTGSPVSANNANLARVLQVTLSSNVAEIPLITGTLIAALTGLEDRVSVNVSDCTGATGWILDITSGNEIATDTSSTSSVKDYSVAPSGSTTVTLTAIAGTGICNIAVDFMSFGNGVNDAVYRLLLVEDDDSGVFIGDIEYIMLNQLNSDVNTDIPEVVTTGSSITMVLAVDHTGTSAPRIQYGDTDSDGIATNIADQADANTHSGVVSFDTGNYKIADTVTVTLVDMDLNTDSSLIDVYISDTKNVIGDSNTDDQAALLHILDVQIGGENVDLDGLGFNLVETDVASGIFVSTFQIPDDSTPGEDLSVNYVDWLDASGNKIEVGDSASITATSGSIALDRSVYPVPFGDVTNLQFLEHGTAANDIDLAQGDVTVWITVTDADYDTSAAGEDTITDTTVTVTINRGSASSTPIVLGDSAADALIETTPDSGVFEISQTITFTSGPSTGCPTVFGAGCILQGDIITVEYADKNTASGSAGTSTDSATFDLRNGVLQSDKSVYLIGSDMILTLIEQDFNLDSDSSESYTLKLIEWDSDAATTTLGPEFGENTAFDPEPSDFRETGSNTGIFQVVIEIPATLDSNLLDRGEEIGLEFTDWGPAGANYVGQESEDIGLTIFTSNFGATIELDQKVYTWTDKVYITIVAPDHNFSSDLVDEIGDTGSDPIKISTRGHSLSAYTLVETGPDTGIFTGEVILTGFSHDSNGDGTKTTPGAATAGTGPTNGTLETDNDDGLTVSFEFSSDQTIVNSALIRWNIGEVQWLEASYPASGTGIIRVIDTDMNLNPEAIDNFKIDAWSDSDAGGISITVTETNEATGIFEGTVFFTVSNDSSGHRLRVGEGDTVTAEYEDNTLPDPYTTADELDIAATTLIGTIVSPLERAPATNLRTVDAFGNSLDAVSVDQQVQISADLVNGQDKEQLFAYLVQIQDGNGVTVSLAWITGQLTSGQSFSPALSWIPTEAGTYIATAFVWESIDNPTALSPSVSTTISVS